MAKSIPEVLQENKIIVITSRITADETSAIIMRLLEWSSEDPNQEIQLYINSGTYNYNDCISIYDVLMEIPNPISATCMSKVAGFSLLFLAAANKGLRRTMKHTGFYFSQPIGYLGSGGSQQTEIQIEANETTLMRNIFEQILSERFEKPIEEIHQMCEDDKELTAFEAVEYGIIDAVMG